MRYKPPLAENGDTVYYLACDHAGDYHLLRGTAVKASRVWVRIKPPNTVAGDEFSRRQSDRTIGLDPADVWRRACGYAVADAWWEGLMASAKEPNVILPRRPDKLHLDLMRLLAGFERWVRQDERAQCRSDGTVSQQPRVLSTGGP